MSELVLAIRREVLKDQAIGTEGIYPIDLHELDQHQYAWLPRDHADDKSENALSLGFLFPQILGYVQIVNMEGHVLAYQRKGKEKGLFGKWSIGIGGHISQEDLLELESDFTFNGHVPDLNELIAAGTLRELKEELGIDLGWSEFSTQEDVIDKFSHIVSTLADPTSSVHVGLLTRLVIDTDLQELQLEPSEFNNWKWVTEDYLKDHVAEFETWSKLVIESM